MRFYFQGHVHLNNTLLWLDLLPCLGLSELFISKDVFRCVLRVKVRAIRGWHRLLLPREVVVEEAAFSLFDFVGDV